MSGAGFSTCLWFDTQGEEAARFYVDVFQPDAELGRVSRYGEAGPGEPGTVMTVEFTLRGQRFVALNGGPQYQFTPAVSLQVMCENQEEVDRYWSRLTEGGQAVACGWLTDRFGFSWQVVPTVLPDLMQDPDPERAGRVAKALYQMTKIDIAELERAAARA